MLVVLFVEYKKLNQNIWFFLFSQKINTIEVSYQRLCLIFGEYYENERNLYLLKLFNK